MGTASHMRPLLAAARSEIDGDQDVALSPEQTFAYRGKKQAGTPPRCWCMKRWMLSSTPNLQLSFSESHYDVFPSA